MQSKVEQKYAQILVKLCGGSALLGAIAIGVGLYFSLYSVLLIGLYQLFVTLATALVWGIVQKRAKTDSQHLQVNQPKATEELVRDLKVGSTSQTAKSTIDSAEVTLESDAESVEKAVEGRKKRRQLVIPSFLTDLRKKIGQFRYERAYPLVFALAAIVALVGELWIFLRLRSEGFITHTPSNIWFLLGFGLVLISFLYLLGANWFKDEKSSENTRLMLSEFLRGGQWFILGTGLIVGLLGIGWYSVERYFVYVTFVLMGLLFLEVAISGILKFIFTHDEEDGVIELHILSSFLSGANPVTSLLDSLESKMGISLRSTWAITVVRKSVLPLTLIMILLLWGMTSLVELQPTEKGVIYHFGQLQKERILEPGLHVKWPWPIDTVKIYPAHQVQYFTVGYESNEPRRDYLWTRNHGGEEYKLLLGDGRELVSINMQVSYQIANLNDYITHFAQPEEILKAEAYRILLQEMVRTNLDQLLSQDRSTFAQMLTSRLRSVTDEKELGLDVVNIALISIHPPVEMAEDYQAIVSAIIEKDTLRLTAETDKERRVTAAEVEREALVRQAEAASIKRWGEVNGEITTHTYQKEAYSITPALYKKWKWLEAMEKALMDKRIYLLDEAQEVEKSELWVDFRTNIIE